MADSIFFKSQDKTFSKIKVYTSLDVCKYTSEVCFALLHCPCKTKRFIIIMRALPYSVQRIYISFDIIWAAPVDQCFPPAHLVQTYFNNSSCWHKYQLQFNGKAEELGQGLKTCPAFILKLCPRILSEPNNLVLKITLRNLSDMMCLLFIEDAS